MREDKAEQVELTLSVGETVMVSFYHTGAKGVIVQRLNAEYVRVRWSDFLLPTDHSDRTLRRVGDSDRF